MKDQSASGILATAIEKIKDMVDCQTIIGDAIDVGDGIRVIPISKVTYGFASGGSDFPTKSNKELFGGGGGAGVTSSPIAFIAINGDSVKMLPVYNELTTLEKAVSMAPEIIDKAKDLFAKDKPSVIE